MLRIVAQNFGVRLSAKLRNLSEIPFSPNRFGSVTAFRRDTKNIWNDLVIGVVTTIALRFRDRQSDGTVKFGLLIFTELKVRQSDTFDVFNEYQSPTKGHLYYFLCLLIIRCLVAMSETRI